MPQGFQEKGCSGPEDGGAFKDEVASGPAVRSSNTSRSPLGRRTHMNSKQREEDVHTLERNGIYQLISE